MVRAAFKYVPQPAATTFAFPSEFILLLCPGHSGNLVLYNVHLPGVVSAGIDEVPERHHVGPLLQLHLVTTHPVIRKNTIQRSFFRWF